jgi:ubiquinone/menaquinone biosynthesis C-methylase UbiE
MSQHRDPQFDRYAHSYRDLHRDSVRLSGEEPEFFAAYKVDFVATHLASVATPLRLLDFGCGVGGSLQHMRRRFPQGQLYGVDVSEESLALARKAHPHAEFSLVQGSTIGLPDDSVDVAMAACVFHHIPPSERASWVSELHRVLRPGGTLFVFEHNPLNPLTRKVVNDCPFDDDAILLPRRETTTLLRNAGFEDVEADYIVFFPQALAALRPIERHLGWLPAGAQYAVHGRA